MATISDVAGATDIKRPSAAVFFRSNLKPLTYNLNLLMTLVSHIAQPFPPVGLGLQRGTL